MSETKSIVDAAIGGSIMTMTFKEAYELMEKLTSNLHQMMCERTSRKPTPKILQMDAFNTLSTQLLALNKHVQSLEVQSQASA